MGRWSVRGTAAAHHCPLLTSNVSNIERLEAITDRMRVAWPKTKGPCCFVVCSCELPKRLWLNALSLGLFGIVIRSSSQLRTTDLPSPCRAPRDCDRHPTRLRMINIKEPRPTCHFHCILPWQLKSHSLRNVAKQLRAAPLTSQRELRSTFHGISDGRVGLSVDTTVLPTATRFHEFQRQSTVHCFAEMN